MEPRLLGLAVSYADLASHAAMIFDGVRNSMYGAALRSKVEPGIRVMDLGAGLGLFGLMAARLGAGEVHLVEPSPVVGAARKLAEHNGLGCVKIHPHRIEDVPTEFSVDVIVSVFTGNFLLAEDLLPSLLYARDHFLAEGGTLIPDRGEMCIAPVRAPALYRNTVEAWRAYPQFCHDHTMPELDLAAISETAVNSVHFCDVQKTDVSRLAEPVTLLELDFTTCTDLGCDNTIEVEITASGMVHGWLGWSRMRLGENWLSTSGEHYETHWSQAFLPLAEPIEVVEGDVMKLRLKRPQNGNWTWITSHKDVVQRQSSFLSRFLRPVDIEQASGRWEPQLNARGEAALLVVSNVKDGISAGEIAQRVHTAFPDQFPDLVFAATFVNETLDGLVH